MDKAGAVMAPGNFDKFTAGQIPWNARFNCGLASIKGIDSNDFTGQTAGKSNAFIQDTAGTVNANPGIRSGLGEPTDGVAFIDDGHPFVNGSKNAHVVITMASKARDGAFAEVIKQFKTCMLSKLPNFTG